jgi:hypothetical protein
MEDVAEDPYSGAKGYQCRHLFIDRQQWSFAGSHAPGHEMRFLLLVLKFFFRLKDEEYGRCVIIDVEK